MKTSRLVGSESLESRPIDITKELQELDRKMEKVNEKARAMFAGSMASARKIFCR